VSRRADLLWGGVDEATRANKDSFFYTNITPQMDDFNQSTRGGLWGCLENALYEQARTGHRISVFGGPILERDDVRYEDILVPDEFWKLLVYVVDEEPRAKAFVLKQTVKNIDTERIELPKWEPFAKTVAYVSDRTSLDFGVVGEWDRTEASLETEEIEAPIRDLSEIDW
jgi:endonuclease G